MCSNDPWSCGSTRRQSERGSSDRFLQNPVRRAPCCVLSPLGGKQVVVLQVARSVPDADGVAPPGPRPRRSRRLYGLRWHLRLAAGRRRVAQRRLGDLDEHCRRLDAAPGPHGPPETPSAQGALIRPEAATVVPPTLPRRGPRGDTVVDVGLAHPLAHRTPTDQPLA